MRALSILILLFFAGFIAQPATARELTDAPEAEIIGFSPDGRYFAYEQYAWDVVSDAVYSAVFVIDRDTNALVPDFPIGLVPEEVEGQFPGRVGGFDPDPALIDTGDGTPDLLGLRKAVRDEAKVRLDALEIGLGGRRLAGVPLTQRGPAETPGSPLIFVLTPSLPGAVPDLQHIYTIEPVAGGDPLDCGNGELPAREKKIDFNVTAAVNWPAREDVGKATTSYTWQIPAASCAGGLWLSDIFAPPAQPETGASVVLLFLGVLGMSHADMAGWHALFVTLPEPQAK